MKRLCLMLIFVFVGLCLGQQDQSADLYSDDPNVESLTGSNLAEKALHQDRVIVAIFYVNWCGHCIRLSVPIKALAKRIQSWRPAVQVVALDCATYPETCSQHDITAFPQVRLLHSRSEDLKEAPEIDNLLLGIPDMSYQTVRDFVLSDSFISGRYSLTPIYVTKKEEICSTFKVANKSIDSFVIVEVEPSVTSAEILLDLLPYRKSVNIERFYGDTDLMSHIHVNSPAILKADLDSCTFRARVNSGENMTFQAQEFTKFIRNDYKADHHPPIRSVLKTNRTVTKFNMSYTDLYNTLRYSLLKEVPRFTDFNRTQTLVLKQYFAVIFKYFPFRNENVRRIFARMNHWFASKNGPMKSVLYREAMRMGNDGFLKPMENWRHCNGSKPNYRGYPCGLWTLFHTLTVGEYNSFKKAEAMGKNASKHEVLQTMRDYVQTFFSCDECASHFKNATLDMENELTSPNSSVLFLWRIHNQVNHRLHGDLTEDPHFPKVQFPSKKMCDRCSEGDHFNTTEVFSFLVKRYSRKSIENSSTVQGLSFGVSLLALISLLLLAH